MKILLVGEFSSLHRYLKEGLQSISDNEVTLIAGGDGWKKIGGADIILPDPRKKFFHRIIDSIYILKVLNGLEAYDVVQVINPTIFPTAIARMAFRILRKKATCLSLVAAGIDYGLLESYYNGAFEYYLFDYDKYGLDKYNKNTFAGKKHIQIDRRVEELADVIVPSLYEYSIGHPREKTSDVVPFPINIDSIKYTENIVKEKIVFFHGLNQELAKGTKFIKEALECLKKDYPDEVEVIIDGHMPFEEYTKIMNKANVVIDQCCCYGYGINNCIAMAKGKVTISGIRPETLDAFGIDESPIIHAKPDVDYLYKQMKYIVESRNHITEMGQQSRQYIVQLHNYKIVAKKYMDIWEKAISNTNKNGIPKRRNAI